MNIGIAGLGLIGGSLAKAITEKTCHNVFGYDIEEKIMEKSLLDGSIKDFGLEKVLSCDVCFVCTYPKEAAQFILDNDFSGIVCDVCGVKGYIYNKVKGSGKNYVGTHPMAGKEFSGYMWSDPNLFENASFIITKEADTDPKSVNIVSQLGKEIGFSNIVVTDTAAHDRVIAYTSQLAHVVSNSYIKSDTANMYKGYSAGSFLDMTRVARLEPTMWTQLFLMNKAALSSEIETIISHLEEFKKAIEGNDAETLFTLLKNGSDTKKRLDGDIEEK